MKIEHWRCQAHHGADQLNYRNLLGACLGGYGQPGYLQHCDTKKGDRDLRWNPAEPGDHIETRVRYELNGSIRADDVAFDSQLNDVLNLNLPLLRNSRAGILTGILEWWRREKAGIRGPVTRARFERERGRYLNVGGELAPYCWAAVWWLDQRLMRMAP